MNRYCLSLLLLCLLHVCPGHAQLLHDLFRVATDTSYVSEHDDDLTVRPFLEHNFNQYRLLNTRTDRTLTYQPNAPLQAGIGISYRIIGIGLGLALPFVNQYSRYGKGRITDFSSHFYLRRITIDAYYQYYAGQHLINPAASIHNWNSDEPYLRNDVTTKVLGIGFHYLLRPKPFSLEPLSFVHYQKKSAGSFMAGMQLTRTGIYGDSTLLPAGLNNNLTGDLALTRSLSWNISANGGYAYTLVIRRHWFVTAAANIGLGISLGELDANFGTQIRGSGILINGIGRLAVGYNSEYFFTGLQYTGYSGINQTPLPYLKQQYSVSRVNLTVARRLRLRKRLLGFY